MELFLGNIQVVDICGVVLGVVDLEEQDVWCSGSGGVRYGVWYMDMVDQEEHDVGVMVLDTVMCGVVDQEEQDVWCDGPRYLKCVAWCLVWWI